MIFKVQNERGQWQIFDKVSKVIPKEDWTLPPKPEYVCDPMGEIISHNEHAYSLAMILDFINDRYDLVQEWYEDVFSPTGKVHQQRKVGELQLVGGKVISKCVIPGFEKEEILDYSDYERFYMSDFTQGHHLLHEMCAQAIDKEAASQAPLSVPSSGVDFYVVSGHNSQVHEVELVRDDGTTILCVFDTYAEVLSDSGTILDRI